MLGRNSQRLLSHIRSRLTHSSIMTSSPKHCTVGRKSRLFAVESNCYSNDFYFTSTGSGYQIPSVTATDWPMLADGGCAYSVCITIGPRVRAARLHKSLGQQLSELFHGSQVFNLMSYVPGNLHGSLEKGFLVLDPRCCPDTENRLYSILREYKQDIQLCSYREGEGGQVWQCWWDLNGGAKEIERSPVMRMDTVMPSPFVDNIKGSAVFYSLEDACAVLQESSTVIPEAKRVLELMDQNKIPERGHFSIIVIEGLDATGKSTLTESLTSHLKATLLKSPPECISQWRKTFDEETSLIRRAYYALGNYVGAVEIAKASQIGPVIVDRFWHSTAAYAIATEIGGGVHNLPDHHHEVYSWPDDLLKPDLIILLTVCDEERISRIRKRGLQETREEKELEANNIFRQKVEEAYRRMENPGCVILDASSSKETVLQEALCIIKKHCRF
ncbi:UMP-CMP kinase 2, mitochondrial-like isoform X1 [Pseudophryne corroboree]|uniref:UMP-CMP kinase 2, mitochondrial-like isoform X1 n=2 Tax=Pseudophryne corroboree TaxID=495146 RepID=UPI003081BC96